VWCLGPRRPSRSPVRHTSFTDPYQSGPVFIRLLHGIWSCLSQENRERFNHRLNVPFLVNSWSHLNPRPWTVNDHPSVLAHEMMVIESGEKTTHMLTWKPTSFISHIQSRSHDDSFPLPLWETWFCQSLGVPIPDLIANPQQCPCRQFNFCTILTLSVITFRRVSVNL